MTTAQIILVLLIPFAGTVVGAASSLMLGERVAAKMQKVLLGFASGVMVAASVWSLLIPAIDVAQSSGGVAWLPALVGFLGGMALMLALDSFTPHQHIDSQTAEGLPSSLGRSTMLMLAVTLHNIPEGMAVGVVLAGAVSGQVDMSIAAAIALSAGIAMQNMPEGAIISLPLRSQGMSAKRSFVYGALSGIVEPIAAAVTILAIDILIPLFPYMLAAAAGAMIYVVVEELIPQAHSEKHSNMPTIAFALGFATMMVLDIALG